MSDPVLAAITATVQVYLDGLYEGDLAKLEQAFHPAAHLFSTTGGNLVDMDMPAWFKLIGGRPAPKASNQTRAYERILLVDITGPNTAFVKVSCAILPKLFTDYLSLVLIDGRWRIINKTFHFELSAG